MNDITFDLFESIMEFNKEHAKVKFKEHELTVNTIQTTDINSFR
jgi:hypothetical protein